MQINGKTILRVFPRKTKATPDDAMTLALNAYDRRYIKATAKQIYQKAVSAEANEIHISTAFTYDRDVSEAIAGHIREVKVGGPAYNEPGGEFVPGLYLKQGYTITSRGCNKKCWYCCVWRREGSIRELTIRPGWIVTDDNLLACSDAHIRAVFDMLELQPEPPRFVGGIEPEYVKPWIAERMKEIRTRAIYCAYDTPDDYEPLVEAGRIFRNAGFTAASHVLACYVLIGYKGDSFEKAESRLIDTIKAGFVPYAMLYRDEQGQTDPAWCSFQREWCRPQIVGVKMREYAVCEH